MKDKTELLNFIQEADQTQTSWRQDAKEWSRMHKGEQWDKADRDQLNEEERPALTFNIIRPLVRLLTGLERKTRYDVRVLPIGEGSDHVLAKCLNRLIKHIETENNALYTYSEAYKSGLITGRGWIKVDIDQTKNIWGDISISEVDPYEMWVDPYTRKYDLSDSRYLIRELYLTEDEVIDTYPDIKDRIDKLTEIQPEHGDTISQLRKTFQIYEMWYKEHIDHWYAIRVDTGEVELIPSEKLRQFRQVAKDNQNLQIEKFTRPEMYFAVFSNNELLEQGKSPYDHNMFPYVPFFADFIPRLGDEKPVWHSIVTDLIDPQKEKNKRKSMIIDIILRFINKGFMFAKGAVLNQDDLKTWGRKPGFSVELAEDKYDKFQILEGSAPDPVLFTLDAVYDQDVHKISGINPPMLGQQESSRESGRTVMLRQQQGSTMLTPYNDNMRLTRQTVAKQVLGLIQQIYTMGKMMRLLADNEQGETGFTPEEGAKLQALMKIKSDLSIGRYDVLLSDGASTPTTRQMEFIELLELIKEGVVPITPNISKLVIKTSDLSVKNELLAMIEQEMQQQAQQAQQQQIQQAIMK